MKDSSSILRDMESSNNRLFFKRLTSGHLCEGALDFFKEELCAGNLATIEQCLLSQSMRAGSIDYRARMKRSYGGGYPDYF